MKISPPPFLKNVVAKGAFCSKVHPHIYAVAHALKKQYCAMGGTNIPFAEVIAKSQHEYINRARLTGVLSRGILQLPKICSSLSLIKFMVQGRITKRLQYNFHFRVNML